MTTEKKITDYALFTDEEITEAMELLSRDTFNDQEIIKFRQALLETGIEI